jgi:flagella basal body P-ring formation protein FlgA
MSTYANAGLFRLLRARANAKIIGMIACLPFPAPSLSLRHLRLGLLLLAGLSACAALAQIPAPARQTPESLRQFAQQFLKSEALGLPGEVHVTAGAVDARLNLPACAALQGFLPPGSRVWGKTTVGIRCNAPTPWTIYVPAQVQVDGAYYVSAAALVQGQGIALQDMLKSQGDLAALPAGVITDPQQALGRSLTMSVTPGTPLRADLLRQAPAIVSGQAVRIIAAGAGFSVSTEGRALAAAAEGQPVQARTNAGQVVSGIAKTGGIVALNN